MSEWTSPIGSTHDEAVSRRMRNPAYARARAERRVPHAIARTVILARAMLGWSQSRLAREIGTTQSVVSRIESGTHKVSADTLHRLANALGVSFTIDPDPPA